MFALSGTMFVLPSKQVNRNNPSQNQAYHHFEFRVKLRHNLNTPSRVFQPGFMLISYQCVIR